MHLYKKPQSELVYDDFLSNVHIFLFLPVYHSSSPFCVLHPLYFVTLLYTWLSHKSLHVSLSLFVVARSYVMFLPLNCPFSPTVRPTNLSITTSMSLARIMYSYHCYHISPQIYLFYLFLSHMNVVTQHHIFLFTINGFYVLAYYIFVSNK